MNKKPDFFKKLEQVRPQFVRPDDPLSELPEIPAEEGS